MTGPERHRCEELTKRSGLQCLRQAMHYDSKANIFRCQQHWEMWMTEQEYTLS